MYIQTCIRSSLSLSFGKHFPSRCSYHPHREGKSSLLQCVKPSLIWTVAFACEVFILDLSSVCSRATTQLTKCLHQYCKKNRRHTHTHAHALKTITTIYSFSFYSSLCLEIAGSIFFINHITWHDAPKFLLYLFTGIHWIEHKVSQWIHNWRFAHCTYNSEWHFPDFLLNFLSPSLPF